MVTFNDIGGKGVEVLPISPNGQDERFINLNKQIREEVYSGHKIAPIIVGLPGDGGWSNNADEKRTAEESFQRKWVATRQKTIEEYINAILIFNETKGSVYVEPLDPSRPQFSSAEILASATSGEKRQLLGLPKSNIEISEVNDRISQLHPLVASEVVRRMSNTDLLKMVGIEPSATVVKTIETEFSKTEADDAFINFFSNSGIDDSELEVISSREIFAKDIEDAEAQEHKFISRAESTILNILRQNSKATTKELSELLKVTEKEVSDILDRLKNANLLTPENTVTEEGDKAIDESELFTVYKYAKRNDVSGASILETSHDFCKRMVTLSLTRSWTLNEIKLMSNGTGLDVFRSRGGWMTLKGTNTHVPYCRHLWLATLVRRKPQ
jgi:predicted transcriptional regulator